MSSSSLDKRRGSLGSHAESHDSGGGAFCINDTRGESRVTVLDHLLSFQGFAVGNVRIGTRRPRKTLRGPDTPARGVNLVRPAAEFQEWFARSRYESLDFSRLDRLASARSQILPYRKTFLVCIAQINRAIISADRFIRP